MVHWGMVIFILEEENGEGSQAGLVWAPFETVPRCFCKATFARSSFGCLVPCWTLTGPHCTMCLLSWYKAALKCMTSRASLLPTLCLIIGCELLAHSLASNMVWWQCGNDTKGRIGNCFWNQKQISSQSCVSLLFVQ